MLINIPRTPQYQLLRFVLGGGDFVAHFYLTREHLASLNGHHWLCLRQLFPLTVHLFDFNLRRTQAGVQ